MGLCFCGTETSGLSVSNESQGLWPRADLTKNVFGDTTLHLIKPGVWGWNSDPKVGGKMLTSKSLEPSCLVTFSRWLPLKAATSNAKATKVAFDKAVATKRGGTGMASIFISFYPFGGLVFQTFCILCDPPVGEIEASF